MTTTKSGLSIDAIIELLRYFIDGEAANGQTSSSRQVLARHQLYKNGLMQKDRTYGQFARPARYTRSLTNKGETFAKMLLATPLPVEVNTPRWADPREEKDRG